MSADPEQWAVELATDIDGAASVYEDAFDVEAAALTIQRAFEERTGQLIPAPSVDDAADKIMWHVEQVMGPVSRELCENPASTTRAPVSSIMEGSRGGWHQSA